MRIHRGRLVVPVVSFVVAATGAAGAHFAPPAHARLILHRSIDGVQLGATEDDVLERLGRPDRRRVMRPSFSSYATARWAYVREKLRIELGELGGPAHVVGLETRDPRERTAEGLGVGSTEAQLRRAIPRLSCYYTRIARVCAVSRPRSPDVQTAFSLCGGRVFRVLIDIRPPPV